MRKNMYKITILLVLFYLTGCGAKEKAADNMENNISGLFQEVEGSQASEKAPLVLDGEGYSRDVLCETLAVKDALQQAEYNSMNRMLSESFVEENQKSLFCIDAATGAVYFVNQYNDWYIYRMLDGKIELAVALPAKELYMWGSTLYFMVESYGKYELESVMDGDILAYTPTDGFVKLVYSGGEITQETQNDELLESLQKMTVSEEGIHFVGNLEKKFVELEGMTYTKVEKTEYTLPFGAEVPKEDVPHMTKSGWGEYYFVQKVVENGTELVMYPRGTEKSADTMVKLNMYDAVYYAVMNDILYCLCGKEVQQLNLVTGDRKVYDFSNVMNLVYAEEIAVAESRVGETYLNKNTNEYFVMEYHDPVPQMTRFIIVGHNVWAYDYNGYLYCMNTESRETKVYQVAAQYTIDALYTDGEELYIADSYEVVRALIEEAQLNEKGIYILKTESLVK